MKNLGLFGLGVGIAVAGAGLPINQAVAQSGDGAVVIELNTSERINHAGIKRAKGRLPILKNIPNLDSTRSSRGLKPTPPLVMVPKGSQERTSRNYGNYKFPHTTSAVAGLSTPKKGGILHSNTSARPYLTTGKLYMQYSGGVGTCTGSMIGKGIVVTASHCIYSYGKKGSAPKAVYFVPAATANSLNSGPIGYWKASKIYLPQCYVNGNCTGSWYSNDVALLKLAGKTSALPYNKGAGQYGYATGTWGWSKGGSFINSKLWLAQITQLGYPANLGVSSSNPGSSMIRTDSIARYYLNGSARNFLWGSGQTQGSSGGPILQNFGRRPHVTARGWKGHRPNANILTGVTSYGINMPKGHLLGATFWTTSVNYPSLYKDTAGKAWGYGPLGFLMRQVCGKGHGNLNATYCGY